VSWRCRRAGSVVGLVQHQELEPARTILLVHLDRTGGSSRVHALALAARCAGRPGERAPAWPIYTIVPWAVLADLIDAELPRQPAAASGVTSSKLCRASFGAARLLCPGTSPVPFSRRIQALLAVLLFMPPVPSHPTCHLEWHPGTELAHGRAFMALSWTAAALAGDGRSLPASASSSPAAPIADQPKREELGPSRGRPAAASRASSRPQHS